MSAFFKAVWERVVVGYGSTLKGLGVGILVLILDQFILYVAGDVGASAYLKAAAALAALIGAALKPKAALPAP